MEKIDVSSEDSFTVDERSLPRSFMYIRKNTGPKIEPWGTPVSIGDHENAWLFKKTCWNLPLKKLLISFRKVPEISADWILQINPSHQTLPKALNISKVTSNR